MPGARACLFSLHDEPVSLPLRLEPLHFEALFCLAGSITLTRRDNTILTASVRQVLLLTDLSDLSGANVDAPLAGILVAVDARGARESLQTICDLLGGLTLDTGRVRHWMASRGGCAVEGPTDWSRAAFANLGCLPQSERARWCVWKSVELLYLLCNPKEQEDATLALERETARRLAEIRRYMEEHLDEPLTIPFLSRRACLSTTTFKEGLPPPVRSPCSHLAAPAADGTGGGAAAGLLPQRAGGSPIGRIWAAPASSPPPFTGSTV